MNPYKFQDRGIAIVRRRKNILLADQMGLGKSMQAIKAAGALGPILVVCPAGLRANWANEFTKWGRDAPHVVIPQSAVPGMNRKAKSAGSAVDFLWHNQHPELRIRPHVDNIVSYGYAIAHQDTIACHRWEIMILDEAHELSNPGSKRSRAIFGGNGIAKACVRIWALTGTPMRNTVADLWIWCRKFAVTKLDFREWVNEYCEWYPVGRTHEMRIVKSRPEKLKEVHHMLSKIMLRRTKKEVNLQLPPLRISECVIDGPVVTGVPGFDPSQYNQAMLERDLVLHTMGEPIIWGGEHLALLQGLAQSVPTLQRYTGLQKVPQTVDFVHNALDEEPHLKALILFTHQSVGEAYAARLAGYGARLVYGPSSDRRDDYIQEFQISNNCRVLIGQYKSIGFGHNITRADLVIAAEQPWDPATLAQGIDRAHRIGRTEMVDVRLMVLNDPLDRAICRLLQRKTRDIGVVVDGEEAQ